MTLVVLRLMIDSGLVVLIWIIQLIVYPSFSYYKPENLITWHRKYTPLIGCLVGPLMLSQLGIALYQIIQEVTPINLINLSAIGILWISTFLQFMPIHNSISEGEASNEMLKDLVRKNWVRTLLWTFLLVLNITTIG